MIFRDAEDNETYGFPAPAPFVDAVPCNRTMPSGVSSGGRQLCDVAWNTPRIAVQCRGITAKLRRPFVKTFTNTALSAPELAGAHRR